MIYKLDTSNKTVAFRALGQVTQEEYEAVVIPTVELEAKRMSKTNFLLLLDTDIMNFTIGTWLQDAILRFMHLGKWKRVAVVTDSEEIISFINKFNATILGEFRIFKKEAFRKAMRWVEGKGLIEDYNPSS